MIKKVFVMIFCFLSLTCFTCMAQETPVDMEGNPPEDPNEPHRAPAKLPTLTYEDAYLYVYAPYYIDSMTVIVKDAFGSVIYSNTTPMVAGQNTLVLSDAVSEDKYSVELLFGSWHLIGYF